MNIQQNHDSKTISIGNTKFKVINLSKPLSEDTEVYPGDPKLKKNIFCSFKKNGCQYNIYSLPDHIFHPHGDAPNQHNPEFKEIGFEHWNLDYVFNTHRGPNIGNRQSRTY